jgi:hypothetical protein
MANAFDTVPETEPAAFIAGDFVTWKRTDLGTDYPPASYALSYKARLEGTGSTVISITASESGSTYLVELSSVTTAAYTAGVYHWQAYITRTSDSARITLDEGTFTVEANRSTATTDPRSSAKIILDSIEAVIRNRATQDQMAYTIQGRSLSRTPIADLLLLRDRFKAEYQRELDAERLANGLPSRRKILTRFK